MSFIVARWIVGIFTFISMVHLYWAAGGKLGSLAAIPQLPGEFASGPRPAFKPSALGTLLVAMGLVAIALLVLPAGRAVFLAGVPWRIAMGHQRDCRDHVCQGNWAIRSWWVFSKRSVGRGLHGVDTYFYSPLCLVLGAGLLVVAWS